MSTSEGAIIVTETQFYKTVWDWLNLLGVFAVPIVVGLGAAWYTIQQGKTKDREVKDNQNEAALQAYIDKMSELLLYEHLGKRTADGQLHPAYAQVRNVARVRTITVLTQLDARRVGSSFTFLREAGLLLANRDDNVVSLQDADFRNVNWSGASLGQANLNGASFWQANLSEASLRQANLSGASLGQANLSRAELVEANLSGAYLWKADLIEADFYGADLSGANFSEANLSGAKLWQANLSRAELVEANLSGAYLIETNLSQANLGGANLSGAYLIETNLSRAELVEANLSGADLIETNLSQANLGGANLSGAYLWKADLIEANFYGALQPHFLITAIERKLFSLSSTCCEHIVEMSRIFIGKVYMGPNQIFPMVCRNRAWSGHRT